MKVCKNCGTEIFTKDGINLCSECEDATHQALKAIRVKRAKKARHQAMLDLGLVRVQGALGGIYYE